MSSRGLPIIGDDASAGIISSAFSPESFHLSDYSSQYQKPYHNNQTLEDAFTRLSVSASPFDSPPSDHPFGRYAFYLQRTSNPTQTGLIKPGSVWNNSVSGPAANAVESLASPRSLNSSCSGSQPSFSDGFLDSAPLLSESLQNKSHGGEIVDVPWLNLNEWRGRVLMLAKDQYGCRVLQERMKRMVAEDFSFVFSKLINHVTELMVDPFGNYVFQKMVEICSDEQRTHIILVVTQPTFLLVRICLKPHGYVYICCHCLVNPVWVRLEVR